MGTEDWRLRRADELFGSGRLRPSAPPAEPGTMPAPREVVAPTARVDVPSPADRVAPPVTTPPTADARSPYRAPPIAPPVTAPVNAPHHRRRAAWGAALFVVAGLIAGVLIGWLVRGPSRVAVVATPRIAAADRVPPPHAATPVRVPLPQPAAPVTMRPEPVGTVVATQAPPSPSRPARMMVAAGIEKRPAARRNMSTRAAMRAKPPIRRPRGAGAPSYDCRRNRGAVLRVICSDPALSALDRQLSARFAALDARVDPATVQRIHRGETAFLNDRQSCRDRACLIAAYRTRLRQLDDD